MSKVSIKNQAIHLRKSGLSYGEIKNMVGVSKSTLSLWLKSIPLKAEHRERLYTKQVKILSMGARSQKERRAREVEQIISNAEREVSLPVTTETYRLMGAALYWAEGSKRDMFNVTNSDPYLMLFMVRWIEKVFSIPASMLKARLNIYPQQNELEIKRFWSELTHVPLENFGKSYVKPLSKNYKKNNLYYWTLRIEMPKSVNNKHRVFGWLNAVLKEIQPEVQFIQRKWQSTLEVPCPVNLKTNPPPIT